MHQRGCVSPWWRPTDESYAPSRRLCEQHTTVDMINEAGPDRAVPPSRKEPLLAMSDHHKVGLRGSSEVTDRSCGVSDKGTTRWLKAQGAELFKPFFQDLPLSLGDSADLDSVEPFRATKSRLIEHRQEVDRRAATRREQTTFSKR